jgi:hypothetical protein
VTLLASEFVQDELDSFEGSIRYFGGVLLEQICKKGKERAYQYLFMPQVLAVFERFSGFDASTAHLTHTAALQMDTILHLESVLWSIGHLGVSYMKNVKFEEKFRRRASQNLNGSLDSKSEEVNTQHSIV